MKNIICAYDFSEASENALRHASRLADFFAAKLTLVHIYNVPVPVTEFGYVDVGNEVIRKRALNDLTEIKKNTLNEHKLIPEMDIIVETGLLKHKLSELAHEKQSDLLVMGIDNDKNFVKEHILGSSSIDEARNFNVSVLIVPKNSESTKIKSIAYACDYKYSLVESSSLIQVKYYATIFGAELKIIHVMEPDHQMDFAEATRDKYIELKLEGIEHKTFFVYEKNAAEGIIDFVKAHDVDMIIVEPHHRKFFTNLFHKSTTKELAFHVNKPILAIHGS